MRVGRTPVAAARRADEMAADDTFDVESTLGASDCWEDGVLDHLDVPDLCRLARVSHAFRFMIYKSAKWRHFARRDISTVLEPPLLAEASDATIDVEPLYYASVAEWAAACATTVNGQRAARRRQLKAERAPPAAKKRAAKKRRRAPTALQRLVDADLAGATSAKRSRSSSSSSTAAARPVLNRIRRTRPPFYHTVYKHATAYMRTLTVDGMAPNERCLEFARRGYDVLFDQVDMYITRPRAYADAPCKNPWKLAAWRAAAPQMDPYTTGYLSYFWFARACIDNHVNDVGDTMRTASTTRFDGGRGSSILDGVLFPFLRARSRIYDALFVRHTLVMRRSSDAAAPGVQPTSDWDADVGAAADPHRVLDYMQVCGNVFCTLHQCVAFDHARPLDTVASMRATYVALFEFVREMGARPCMPSIDRFFASDGDDVCAAGAVLGVHWPAEVTQHSAFRTDIMYDASAGLNHIYDSVWYGTAIARSVFRRGDSMTVRASWAAYTGGVLSAPGVAARTRNLTDRLFVMSHRCAQNVKAMLWALCYVAPRQFAERIAANAARSNHVARLMFPRTDVPLCPATLEQLRACPPRAGDPCDRLLAPTSGMMVSARTDAHYHAELAAVVAQAEVNALGDAPFYGRLVKALYWRDVRAISISASDGACIDALECALIPRMVQWAAPRTDCDVDAVFVERGHALLARLDAAITRDGVPFSEVGAAHIVRVLLRHARPAPGDTRHCNDEAQWWMFDQALVVVFAIMGRAHTRLCNIFLYQVRAHHGFGDGAERYTAAAVRHALAIAVPQLVVPLGSDVPRELREMARVAERHKFMTCQLLALLADMWSAYHARCPDGTEPQVGAREWYTLVYARLMHVCRVGEAHASPLEMVRVDALFRPFVVLSLRQEYRTSISRTPRAHIAERAPNDRTHLAGLWSWRAPLPDGTRGARSILHFINFDALRADDRHGCTDDAMRDQGMMHGWLSDLCASEFAELLSGDDAALLRRWADRGEMRRLSTFVEFARDAGHSIRFTLASVSFE